MLGRLRPDWCPICHAPPGPDCPSRGLTKRQAKRREKREWMFTPDSEAWIDSPTGDTMFDLSDHSHGSVVEQVHRVITSDHGLDSLAASRGTCAIRKRTDDEAEVL